MGTGTDTCSDRRTDIAPDDGVSVGSIAPGAATHPTDTDEPLGLEREIFQRSEQGCTDGPLPPERPPPGRLHGALGDRLHQRNLSQRSALLQDHRHRQEVLPRGRGACRAGGGPEGHPQQALGPDIPFLFEKPLKDNARGLRQVRQPVAGGADVLV